ncbi:MAG: hypothetical protein EZS28_006051 [Streblomastix strix]|uniref:Uncharacterized protein n=1 Tax=Streblomastix strix TaxID=222440 RepID=A0A5J4WV35_9EUKA|nr:MAG: hypothetical protein EZS28_006051 [Streblomastix strix]
MKKNKADEETEHGKGFLREIIQDLDWEMKLEQDLTKLQAAYKQLPSPITFKFIVNIVISIVAELLILIALILIVVIFVELYSDVAGNIVMSGLRPALLAQIQYFSLRMLYNYQQIDVVSRVQFTGVTSPVWNDSSHVSNNKTIIRELLHGVLEQLRKVHAKVHYGSSNYTETDDSLIDQLHTSRISIKQTASYLLDNATCYMPIEEQCTVAGDNNNDGPFRIYSIQWPISGLSSLISRLYMYVEQVYHMDLNMILDTDFALANRTSGSGSTTGSSSNTTGQKGRGDTNHQFRFINSAVRNDIIQGLLKHTTEILDSGLSTIELSKNVLIYSTIGCSVLQLILVIVNAIPWSQDVVRATTQSKKLLLLLPSQGRGSDRGDDSAEVEMQMLPSMRTGYPPIDDGRERIIEAAVTLLDAIISKESQTQINSLHTTLVQISYRQFTEEEREMIQREYTGSKDITMNDILQSGPGELGSNVQSIMNNVVGGLGGSGSSNEKEKEKSGENKENESKETTDLQKIETQIALLQQQQSLMNTQQQIDLDQNGKPILINAGQLNPESIGQKSVKQIPSLSNDDYLHERPKKGKNQMQHLISNSNDPKHHNFKTHAREHILLRQRLTVIGDQLKVTGDVASKMIAKRNLIKLFDAHFTNADIVFGNTIPEEERTGFDEDEDEKDDEEGVEGVEGVE